MAYLFKVEGRAVFPNPETLLISPFKDIWERDKSKGKEVALEEFTYIEFVASMKKSNPYRQYPEVQKYEKLRDEVITIDGWEADEKVLQGIIKMRKFQSEASTTYSYYIAAKTAAENMQNFFMEVDVTALNFKTGNPIYKPRDITSALNDTEKVLGNLKALEKKVEEELYEDSKMRSDKQISPFANPDSII